MATEPRHSNVLIRTWKENIGNWIKVMTGLLWHLCYRHCLSFLFTRGSPSVSCHVILFTGKVNSCSFPYTLGRQTAQQKAINSHYTVHLASLFHLPWWGFLVRYRTWPNYNHHSQRDVLKRAKWFLGQSESCFLALYWFIETLYTRFVSTTKNYTYFIGHDKESK